MYTPPLLTEEDIEVKECPICILEKPVYTLRTCSDYFCFDCIRNYIELKVVEANVMHIGCPSCNQELIEVDLNQFMTFEIGEKYKRFNEVKRLEENKWIKWCPKPNCQGYSAATASNFRLKCNICRYEYCYNCSEAWHKGKCRAKKDLSYEIWAMCNNVKVCPNCRNHVQKNGGCLHMYCSRCQHRWCWICGGDYASPSHNGFTCMLGRKPLDLYWGIIFLLLVFPALIPFGFLLMVMYMYETESIEKDRFNGILSCLRSRLFVYVLAFIFSPVIECIAIVVLYFAVTFSIASKSSVNTTVEFMLRIIVGNTLCNIIFVIGAGTLALAAVVMPLAGVFFFITKISYAFGRCFKPKPEFEYPRDLLI